MKEKRAGHGGPVSQRRIPLTGADRQPVLLDDLPAHAGVRAVTQAISGGPRMVGPLKALNPALIVAGPSFA